MLHLFQKITINKLIIITLITLSSSLFATNDKHFLMEEYEDYIVLENNEKFHEIIVFQTHIAFTLKHLNEKTKKYFIDGFVVYDRDKKLNYIDHPSKYEPVYTSSEHVSNFYFAAWFMGVHKGLLFVDYGTGPGTRGLNIFDLKTKEFLFKGDHRNLTKLNENEILVLERIKNEIVKSDYPEVFNKHKNTVQSYLDEGLYYSFSKKFSFNIRTREITDLNEFICLREQ